MDNPKWLKGARMPKTILVLAIFLASYITLVFPLSSYSRDAMITDILVTNNASHVTVYARVMNCFTKKMESAIMAGVPTTFTFILELHQEHEDWFDKKIAGVVVRQTIKYDNVKKVFYVSSTEAKQSSSFQDFEGAKKAMAELNSAVVAPVRALQKDKAYYIKIKAKLDRVRLPMHMEYVLFFVSLWDFETDWYRQNLVHSSW
ncbi:MAG: DUF4390 domain-containing protein [Deltaproteobacteria bacterium]|nr:DUF4390 domain-containing protein [Deltaproteobacteria bacterium]